MGIGEEFTRIAGLRFPIARPEYCEEDFIPGNLTIHPFSRTDADPYQPENIETYHEVPNWKGAFQFYNPRTFHFFCNCKNESPIDTSKINDLIQEAEANTDTECSIITLFLSQHQLIGDLDLYPLSPWLKHHGFIREHNGVPHSAQLRFTASLRRMPVPASTEPDANIQMQNLRLGLPAVRRGIV